MQLFHTNINLFLMPSFGIFLILLSIFSPAYQTLSSAILPGISQESDSVIV